jgi:AAA15 family ATPase/GTPase
MIEEFSFENFRSFKTMTTLMMSAANIKSTPPELDTDNVINVNNQTQLLKAKAIYGANASGKSNVVKALAAFIKIVVSSVKEENVLSGTLTPFVLSEETIQEPTFFQLVFWQDGVRYRYGFQADNEKIHAEWLYGTPGKREQPYFTREGNVVTSINKTHFSEGEKLLKLIENDEDNPIFRSNSLFLTSVSSFGIGKLSLKLVRGIGQMYITVGLEDKDAYERSKTALESPTMKKEIEFLLSLADTGVERLDIVETPVSAESQRMDMLNEPKERRVVTIRDVYNEKQEKVYEIALYFSTAESEGTKKLFEISTFIINALREGRTFIIDEFDARFHPLITQKLVELFNSNINTKGQLIFVTHDTNLLSSKLLRRDQIDFVEKDKYGASHLFNLLQFKGVRDTDPFEKNYIRGKYGAIPFVGGLNSLFFECEDDGEA